MDISKSVIEIEGNNSDKGVVKYENKGYVRLPVCEEDFKEFISSLLGEPQTIEGRFHGEFEIDIKTIEDLHFLIEQRIAQQNKASFIQFIAKILYNDNSSVTINSFEELSTYNEIRSVYPTGINLTWIYLVQFQDKKTPEKQVINILFSSDSIIGRKTQVGFMLESPLDGGYIEYSIQHTARSWGADIEFLLSSKIKSLFKEHSKLKKFLNKHDAAVGLTVGSFVFIISVIGSIFSSIKFTDSTTVAVSNDIKRLDNVMNKLDYIANYIAFGKWFKFSSFNNLFIIIMVGISTFLGIWVGMNLDIKEQSFILLTEQSKKEKEKKLRSLDKQWAKFAVSVIVSILCSLIASFIFDFISKNKY